MTTVTVQALQKLR